MIYCSTPFTCSICKTEFFNPISLVKHVELKHLTALKLSTINITRTEHRTYSGILIESIIVSELKDLNTFSILPVNHSIEIGGIENCIKENSNNKSKDHNTVPIGSENQIHEESLEIGDIKEHSNNITEVSNALPILFEDHVEKESLEIGDIEDYI